MQNSVAVIATGTRKGVVLNGGLTFDAVFPKSWFGGLFTSTTTADWPFAEIKPPPWLPGTVVMVRLPPVSVDQAALGEPEAAPKLEPRTLQLPPTLLVTLEGLTEPREVIVGCATEAEAALNRAVTPSKIRRDDIERLRKNANSRR